MQLSSRHRKTKERKVASNVEAKSALASIDDFGLGFLYSPNTNCGYAITPEKAMTVPAVNLAVTRIASSLGTIPAKLYRSIGDTKELASDHPASRFVHRYANEWTPAGKLRRQLTQDALLTGNGYAVASRNSEGRVLEFLRVPSSAMSVDAGPYGEPIYTLTMTGGRKVFSFRDVLHIAAPVSFDGLTSRAPISLCREAIALALILEEHGSKLFKNGARPSAALTYPADASKGDAQDRTGAAARRKLMEAARLGVSGVDNAGNLAVFFDGATFTPFALPSTDAQYLENRQFAVSEIARVFSIPPTMLFQLERGTYSNTEQMGTQFVQFTLSAWMESWTDAYARVLFEEGEEDLSIEFIFEDLLRADTAARFAAYSQAIASRILNPNEVRALENRAPYAGGDEFLNPNTTTAATVPAKEAA